MNAVGKKRRYNKDETKFLFGLTLSIIGNITPSINTAAIDTQTYWFQYIQRKLAHPVFRRINDSIFLPRSLYTYFFSQRFGLLEQRIWYRGEPQVILKHTFDSIDIPFLLKGWDRRTLPEIDHCGGYAEVTCTPKAAWDKAREDEKEFVAIGNEVANECTNDLKQKFAIVKSKFDLLIDKQQKEARLGIEPDVSLHRPLLAEMKEIKEALEFSEPAPCFVDLPPPIVMIYHWGTQMMTLQCQFEIWSNSGVSVVPLI
eukprot:TRINITY_DN10479_c0_g1_i1.p2 TRINITY_DN10479_c0_g1~~TRINITY_DN10479_c0_g1_i1.p2  ORF type:complete len:257 (-),score=51.05 TRINITY_DN10479_c0_g1_i1:13-783(-)